MESKQISPKSGATIQGHINRLDALRAMAVIFVLVFHLQPMMLPWGYIGVDMFFTLSGFLMSYLYFSSFLNGNETSATQFIVRRFWRLFPPLAIVVLLTLITAILVMAPLHLVETAKSAIAAILSLSNIYFHSQSGYFDTDAIMKPLLHTWSLGAEEQFYFLFGLAIGLKRWCSLKAILIVLTGLSFSAWTYVLLGEYGVLFQPLHDEPYSSLFFLPQYRIFQFSIGGLAAYAMLSGHRIPASIGFVLLALAALVGADKGQAHLSAPLITIAMCILMMSRSILDVCAENQIVKYIARISYQLYLVHWPIIVFWHYLTFSPLTWFEAIMCGVLCIILADLLYRSTNWMRYAK